MTREGELKRSVPFFAVLAEVAGLVGLVTYLATVVIPQALISPSPGDLAFFVAITLSVGGPLFLFLAMRQAEVLQLPELLLVGAYLIGLVISLILARSLRRTAWRWGLFALLVPFLPPLILTILAWLVPPVPWRSPTRRPSLPISAPLYLAPPKLVSTSAVPSSLTSASERPSVLAALSTEEQHKRHTDMIFDWLNRFIKNIISVDIVTHWPGRNDSQVHRAQGLLRDISEHPSKNQVFRIEFDSHLGEASGDFVTIGYEVTDVIDKGSSLVICKGTNQRMVFSATIRDSSPPAPMPEPEPIQSPISYDRETIHCSVCHRTSDDLMAAFRRERPDVMIMDTTWVNVCPECSQAFCINHSSKVRDSWQELVPGCPVHHKVLQPPRT